MLKRILNFLIHKNENIPNLSVKNNNTTIDQPNFKNNDISTIIKFYNKDNLASFPLEFEKEKYFDKAQDIYNRIGENKFLSEISFFSSLPYTSTEPKIINNNLKIIISMPSAKVGVGSGLKVTPFSEDICNKFCEFLAHELFHAYSITNIVSAYGIDEFKTISNSPDDLAKIAWKTFDEYYACRKNAETFQFFDSVEKIENAESSYNLAKKGNSTDIESMFYTLATMSAQAEVKNDNTTERKVENSNLKPVFYSVKDIFNEMYNKVPLQNDQYKSLRNELYILLNRL